MLRYSCVQYLQFVPNFYMVQDLYVLICCHIVLRLKPEALQGGGSKQRGPGALGRLHERLWLLNILMY